MLNLLEKAYDRIKEIYGKKHFIALLVLLIIVSAAGLLVGAKYTAYIRKDPEYCNSCHLMQKVFSDWHNSDHKTVTCQQCHKLSVIEQDVLLVKHIIYGKTKIPQKHGKQLPWESCGDCHWEQRSQGKDLPEKSYGHFRHDFVECFNCHPFVGHNFPYDVKSCERCHRGKKVHGSGMEGLSCVDCHIFSLREGTEKNRVIPTRQRCMKCHEHTMKEPFPASSPMASLECFECHKPHGDIKPADAVCLGCHAKDLKDKGHIVHKAACKQCHTAHLWKAEATKKLCSSCHSYREPEGVFSKP